MDPQDVSCKIFLKKKKSFLLHHGNQLRIMKETSVYLIPLSISWSQGQTLLNDSLRILSQVPTFLTTVSNPNHCSYESILPGKGFPGTLRAEAYPMLVNTPWEAALLSTFPSTQASHRSKGNTLLPTIFPQAPFTQLTLARA